MSGFIGYSTRAEADPIVPSNPGGNSPGRRRADAIVQGGCGRRRRAHWIGDGYPLTCERCAIRRAAWRIWVILILSWATLPGFAAPYTVSVPNGSSLIANHLDNGGNSLDTVLAGVPDGTQVQKWNCTSFVTYTYDEAGGTWSPPGGTLRPGEGAVIINSSG